MNPKQRHLLGIFSLAVITLLWGGSFPLVKSAVEKTPPFLFNALRFDIATLSLLGLILLQKRFCRWTCFRTGLWIGLSLFLGYSFQTLGLTITSATNSAFLTGLSVVFVPLFGVFFGGRLSAKIVFGVSLAILGLWLLSGGELSALNRGDLFTFFCAIAFAIQILMIGKFGLHEDLIVLTASQMFAVALGSHLASGFFESYDWTQIDPRAWASIIFCGVFLSAIPFVVQVKVQRFVSAVTAAMVFATEPIWGAIAAYVFLGEYLTFASYLGGSLMILGILIVECPPLPKFLRLKARIQ